MITWIYASMTSPVAIALAYPRRQTLLRLVWKRAAGEAVSIEEWLTTLTLSGAVERDLRSVPIARDGTEQSVAEASGASIQTGAARFRPYACRIWRSHFTSDRN